MTQMIAVVGKSKSGKTRLIEKLIPELKKRGYRIGSVKHAHHGFEIDKKGKDSYRHRAAGADVVVVASPDEIAMVKKINTDSLDNLGIFFADMDLVLVEGYKRTQHPKIEVFDQRSHKAPLGLNKEELVAIVTDDAVDVDAPLYRRDQIVELGDLIERRYLKS
ncbi:MAG: molybdopterin-guanine dinucleotide biosynthesis protein B [Deltaproteobacteria bacterium]|nr:MAG: molybdopterin-guanine dinucleotide biosynthesis protein B [Deltaproteobacteria bacterium]